MIWRVPGDLVELYVQHVDHLSNSLLTPEIPLYCKSTPRAAVTSGAAPKSRAVPPSSTSNPVAEKPEVYRHLGRMVQRSSLGDETKSK